MSWNYRVTKTLVPMGDREVYENHEIFEIREVFYKDDGSIRAWSRDAVKPFGESLAELRDDLVKFDRAIQMPIIDLSGPEPVEIPLGEK